MLLSKSVQLDDLVSQPVRRCLSQFKKQKLAVLSNSMTPYRAALQKRILTELPETDAHFLFTHEVSNAPWRMDDQGKREIFGHGEHSEDASRLRYMGREFIKGGRIIEWLQKHRVSHLIIEGYNDIARLRVIRWCHRHNVRCFLWADSNSRSDSASGFKRRAKTAYIKQLNRWCDAFFVCGQRGREYFEAYTVSSRKIFYVPCEPDYGLIESLTTERLSDTRRMFGLDQERRRFLFCGRLVPQKNPTLLAQSFIEIADKRSDWDLVFVGDGPLRKVVEDMLPNALKTRVFWTGFQNDPRTIAAIYKACDVLVLPSRYEPWAVVVNEAAAAGLALICTDVVGAAAELLEDGANGFTIPANDEHALAAAMYKISGNRIDEYKAASVQMLHKWRQNADPINGIREALTAFPTLIS